MASCSANVDMSGPNTASPGGPLPVSTPDRLRPDFVRDEPEDMRVVSTKIDPIVFDDTFCRFKLDKKGILASDSRIQLSCISTDGASFNDRARPGGLEPGNKR